MPADIIIFHLIVFKKKKKKETKSSVTLDFAHFHENMNDRLLKVEYY